jgi:hypothetical protein
MAFVPPKDRVLENSTSNSQTVFSLSGAVDASYNRFSASMSLGDTTVGAVVEPGVAFKSGILTYSATNQVTIDSTGFESKGTFSSGGTKEVFMGLPAAAAVNWGMKFSYIINGAMMASQENGATAGAVSGYYPADEWCCLLQNTAGSVNIAQVAVLTPGGSPNRIRATVTGANSSPASTDYYVIEQRIEGLRLLDLRLGTTSAKTVAIQFGCKGPAGTYAIALRNSALNRTYPTTFTISGGEANTDVVKSVTIALDQAGTWLTNNGVGLEVMFVLMVGSGLQTTTGWNSTSYFGVTGQSNFMGTNGNVFELFDVGLYEGTVAPAFKVPDYADELRKCMRYYQKINNPTGSLITNGSNTGYYWGFPFAVPMRTTPSASINGNLSVTSGSTGFTATAIASNYCNDTNWLVNVTTSAAMPSGAPVNLSSNTNAAIANARL